MINNKIFNNIKNINIPYNLISRYPKKDDVKLMVYYKKKNYIIHDKIINLYKYFNKYDIIIKNDSKAYPIKYNVYKNKDKKGSKIEIILLKELNSKNHIWDILVNPARKVRIGNKLYLIYNKNKVLESIIINNTTSQGRLLKFNFKYDNIRLKKILFKIGKFIIPNNSIKNNNIPLNKYQNYYSKSIGSIMLPTSGIYFNKYILLTLKYKNIKTYNITLHLNFNKQYILNKKNIFKYKNLNYEYLLIKNKITNKINNLLLTKKNIKICSIGINTLRAIENIIYSKNYLIPYKGYISKIFPINYKFKLINSLLTYFNEINTINFLILLNICGYQNIFNIYNEAIKNNYNFYTYGDLLLILP